MIIALIIGYLGVLYIPYVDHWHETVIYNNPEQHHLTTHALAPIVFTMVFALLLVINPLLHLIGQKWKLRRRELIIIFAMWLVTAAISYTNFTTTIVTISGLVMGQGTHRAILERTGMLEMLRQDIFLTEEASRTFLYGMGLDEITRIPLSRIPWLDWARPMLFWIPFALVVLVLSSALVQTLHRQWSKHELLSYPIANVAELIIGQEPNKAFPKIFYNTGFWVGFTTTTFIFMLNGLQRWFPLVPAIPLEFWYSDLVSEFYFLATYCSWYTFSLFRWLIRPYIVALAVLVPTDVSLTCWLGWVLSLLATGVYFCATGDALTEFNTLSTVSGMYVGIGIFILFIGWREYSRILRMAFSFKNDPDPAIRIAAKACRVFFLSFIALVGLLVFAGMDWFIALITVSIFCLMLVLIARITAEIGIPWLLNFWGMTRFMTWRMLGPAAIGPTSLAVLAFVGGVLDLYPANTLAANETTYRKLEEGQKSGLRRRHFNIILLCAGILALSSSLFAHIWHGYSFGARKEGVTRVHVQKQIVDRHAPDLERLQMEGRADYYDSVSGLSKIPLIHSSQGFWRFFLYGVVVILAVAFMRLRFSWWPFHPLPLLFLNTWAMSRMWSSFLIGWLIKMALMKIGGGTFFARSKPFFVGLILGQLATNCFWIFVGIIYYRLTGGIRPPRPISLL